MKRGIYAIMIFLAVILFQTCATQNKSKMKDQAVMITGIAQNGKAGALVKSMEGDIYYIDGLSAWPADMINKQVAVTGDLKIETISTDELKNEQGEWKQGISGKIKTLHNASWKLAGNP